MSNMKCPFCQQELNLVCGTVDCTNFDCIKTRGWYGNKELWQELIRTRKALQLLQELIHTRKALDVAWDGLKKIGSGNIIEHSIVGHENDNKIFIVNKALDESKAALEQKD